MSENRGEPAAPGGHPAKERLLGHGAVLLLPALGLAFVLMSHDGQLPFGVPLGALACVLAALGALQVAGSFKGKSLGPTVVASPSLGRHCVELALVLSLTLIGLRCAVSGTLPLGTLGAGLLVPLLLGSSVLQLYRVLGALGVFSDNLTTPVASSGRARDLLQHPSLLLLLLTLALYTPMLGQFSLIDPWETHYGEVAREILARDDWMSLWWAQDGFFWSKPVLDFWLQALSFALLGVGHAPDAMLSAISTGGHPQPEWAVRLPILLCSLLGQVLLYAGVSKAWGRRAAWLGSVALVSVPYYTLIVHQSMTDLPYIATLMGAFGLFLLGYFTPEEARLTRFAVRLGKWDASVSGHSLVFGTVALFSIPQILYLFSRNLGLVAKGANAGFYTHPDRFFVGSGGGNCTLPGNEACRLMDAVNRFPQPSVSAVCFASLLVWLLYRGRIGDRKKRFYYLGAWLCLALCALAKGLPGPIIFTATVVAFLSMSGRVSELRKLELLDGLLIFCVVALPWYVQSVARHGYDFLDRLFIHDMVKRAFDHVHDTNAGDDVSLRYYLWQLGYGLFPLVGLVALGGLAALGSRARERVGRREGYALLWLWFLVGFAMFTLTRTKYHHYIIPVVPALGLMAGPLFDAALVLPFRFLPRKLRRPTFNEGEFNFPLIGVTAALVTFFAGLDLFGPNKPPGGAARFINLVTYNYTRAWPDTLDYKTILLGVTVTSAVVQLGWLGSRRLRGLCATLTLVQALGFSAWLSNGYLPRVAPHWGQRETIATYYQLRHGPEQPLVAYQMNWKGENFYTGNRLATFISTGEKFSKYLRDLRASGQHVLFVTLEHTRLGNLKRELGQVQGVEVVTDKALNNKFALVRVTL